MSNEAHVPAWLTLTLTLILVLCKVQGCPQPQQAREVLDAEGYTQIEITGGGHGWTCGQEWGATGFRATSPGGARTEGAVCCGVMFKGCTVRSERVLKHPKP